jgi:hypothetical protein
MSRLTNRNDSLPARMAAAGVEPLYVSEVKSLLRGYTGQRLTNSRLYADNMELRRQIDALTAEKAAADKSREAIAADRERIEA